MIAVFNTPFKAACSLGSPGARKPFELPTPSQTGGLRGLGTRFGSVPLSIRSGGCVHRPNCRNNRIANYSHD